MGGMAPTPRNRRSSAARDLDLIEHPVTCLVWALESALARGDFAAAKDASAELRALGVVLRLLPRGHDLARQAVAAEAPRGKAARPPTRDDDAPAANTESRP